MGNVWGERKTIKQIIREQKRINNRSIRDLDRELNRVKREQKKAQNEMKRLAKQGQMQAVKHLAKDIVRMKQSETNFIKLKAELRSLSAAMDSMAATAQLQKCMTNVSRTLGMLSNQVKLPELQAALMKYQIESEKMEMKQDMINDALDDAMDADSDAEDELVQKVLDEVGLQLNDDLVDAPAKAKQPAEEDVVDDNLQQRLNNLKR
jgi:charged multivesicular body protein 2A